MEDYRLGLSTRTDMTAYLPEWAQEEGYTAAYFLPECMVQVWDPLDREVYDMNDVGSQTQAVIELEAFSPEGYYND